MVLLNLVKFCRISLNLTEFDWFWLGFAGGVPSDGADATKLQDLLADTGGGRDGQLGATKQKSSVNYFRRGPISPDPAPMGSPRTYNNDLETSKRTPQIHNPRPDFKNKMCRPMPSRFPAGEKPTRIRKNTYVLHTVYTRFTNVLRTAHTWFTYVLHTYCPRFTNRFTHV